MHLQIALADEEESFIAADSARVQQVLWNVLKNAIKFTSQDGVIKVSTARLAEGRWEVRFTDSGIGMSSRRRRAHL